MLVSNPDSPLNSARNATIPGQEHIPQQLLRNDPQESNDHHDQQRLESVCLLEVPLILEEGGSDRLLEMMGTDGGVALSLFQ